MRNSLRFIHTADLHLDSPFKGLSSLPETIFQDVKNSTFQAFSKIIDAAIRHQVDFMLIAGDLFDAESRSLKAQMKLKKEMERLHKHNIQAFIVHGNHDPVQGDYFTVEWPDNVHVFPDETVRKIPFIKDGKHHLADIYGFSYENRTIHDSKVAEYRINQTKDIFHIGILHGSLSSNEDHDVYAPFRLSDFDDKKMDYWALGHIHKREVLRQDPPVVYPGNIQGRHMKETGEKGGYLVELTDRKADLSFIPVQSIRFEIVHLDAKGCESVDGLEQMIEREKERWRQSYGKCIIRLHARLDAEKIGVLTEKDVDELLEFVNEGEDDERNWIWLERIEPDVKVSWNREELKQGKHFTGELIRQMDQVEDPAVFLEELTEHRAIKKFMDPFTDEELQDILKDAEQLLLEDLLKE